MVLRYAGNRLFSGPALQMQILDPGNCTGSGKTRARRPSSGSISLTRTKDTHGLSRPLQQSLAGGEPTRRPPPVGMVHPAGPHFLRCPGFHAPDALAPHPLFRMSPFPADSQKLAQRPPPKIMEVLCYTA